MSKNSNSEYGIVSVMATKRGPAPKGDREQFTFRLPRTHLEEYRRRAEAAGMPLGDYLATRLAHDHDLGEPGYIRRQNQGQLPLEGITAMSA